MAHIVYKITLVYGFFRLSRRARNAVQPLRDALRAVENDFVPHFLESENF